MRIDQCLNKLCLTKTRSIGKKACDNNLVFINDKQAKASTIVNDNDIVEYHLYGYKTRLRIINVPTGNVSKKNAGTYYELLSKEELTI